MKAYAILFEFYCNIITRYAPIRFNLSCDDEIVLSWIRNHIGVLIVRTLSRLAADITRAPLFTQEGLEIKAGAMCA